MVIEIGQEPSMDRQLFEPVMTLHALRDNRYRHPANALAELIDNSIDARANKVEVLVQETQQRVNQRQRWRISQLAVIDNGRGMSAATLIQALRFGGRQAPNSIQKIGKYGMGLPTSSVSQCKRLDVWSWEKGLDSPHHSYIDVDAIETRKQIEVPLPDDQPIPMEWLDLANLSSEELNQGTLVVWSNIDRITSQTATIFKQVEQEIGRIYRQHIIEGELKIRMASKRAEEIGPYYDKEVRPNDPMYLMKNSSTPDPWHEEPMFTLYRQRTFPVTCEGREELVDVVYSISKPEALGEHRKDLPGNREYGRHARQNMGISVVRENREILLENFFIRDPGGGALPMNRWWGCEVSFTSGCDDLFGLDHNKQMVSHFSRAARDLSSSDLDTQAVLDDLEVGEDYVYEIVADIRNTTRAMMREINRMFSQRPTKSSFSPNSGPLAVEEEAVQVTTSVTKSLIEDEETVSTDTDKQRKEMSEGERTREISDYLETQGIDAPEAELQATQSIQNDDWYRFIPGELTGNQMFSVASRGGILNVSLNVHHPMYEFVNIIEKETEENQNPVARRAAVAIIAMILSWARMEDEIERNDKRLEFQDIATNWGRMMSKVLQILNNDVKDTG